MSTLKQFLREDSGQDLVEYGLLVAFVATASLGIMLQAGTSFSPVWVDESSVMRAAAGAIS
jgi:Flp pilus assembly pilin Flp